MAVNSGTLGTTISWSDLQTAYGGSHPISVSEYYRGGTNVPSTNTVVAANSASGTGDDTTGNITVDVTTNTGSDTTSTITPANVGSFTVTNVANLSYVEVTQGGRGNHTVTQSGAQRYSVQQDDLPTTTLYFRGPTWQSGDGGNNALGYNTPGFGLSGTGNAAFNGFRAPASIFYRTPGVTTYDHDITNNTGHTLNMTMSPWADDSSFTDDETATDDGNSSASWSWSHPAVTQNANTNIPTSGVNNINQYNVPGTFAG